MPYRYERGTYMTNFIFISPNFPENYWLFCKELKNNGINVLGIGEAPYDSLTNELKGSLTEYYKVNSMESYDDMLRAVAFFTFKYGKIDWLESNNEYWLERDATLRTDFNISSGFQVWDMDQIKHKSKMKKFYEAAGVPVARYYLVESYEGAWKFIDEVGFPVITKPDNGVGASDTHKINNEADLNHFFATKIPGVLYIMEEFIEGEVDSYDAIVDKDGNPIFETGTCSPVSIMDIVNNADDPLYHVTAQIPENLRAAGRATVKSFGVKNRFVHFEFFRLTKDQHIGKEGDIVALEVNMRPCGGDTPTMMNYANSTNVYKIWADMIAYGSSLCKPGKRGYCASAGRWDHKNYLMSDEALYAKYSANIKETERIPDAIASTTGNYTYLAVFDTEKELFEFYEDVIKCE